MGHDKGGPATGSSRRKSNEAVFVDSSSGDVLKKPRKSAEFHLPCERTFSPSSLAKKLDQVNAFELMHNTAAVVELGGFDNECAASSAEDYERRREMIRQRATDPDSFDANGRTALNLEGAAIAGAKMVIDETCATRSMCKQLRETLGIDEDSLLYKAIDSKGMESDAVKAISDNRQASLVESLVDYKKQIQFKSTVLQHYECNIKQGRSKTDVRCARQQKAEQAQAQRKRKLAENESRNASQRTPRMRTELNPLDGNRIIDAYALEVASEVRDMAKKRRRIAPIPFDINILDDEDDDELMQD